jgi:hypothetical protein
MNKQPPAGSDEISTHHKSSWASTWTAHPKLQRNCKGDPCNPPGPSEAFVDFHQEIQNFWVGRLCTVSTSFHPSCVVFATVLLALELRKTQTVVLSILEYVLVLL